MLRYIHRKNNAYNFMRPPRGSTILNALFSVRLSPFLKHPPPRNVLIYYSIVLSETTFYATEREGGGNFVGGTHNGRFSYSTESNSG